jgi:transcriptional regulator with XRE-family HTH domain
MSQEKLGSALGLTFQQVQKYERGTNRIGSSRLYQLSRILDVPVSFFFDDMPNEAASRSDPLAESVQLRFDQQDMSKRETLELVRAYYRIVEPNIRKRVFELVKSLGPQGG